MRNVKVKINKQQESLRVRLDEINWELGPHLVVWHDTQWVVFRVGDMVAGLTDGQSPQWFAGRGSMNEVVTLIGAADLTISATMAPHPQS